MEALKPLDYQQLLDFLHRLYAARSLAEYRAKIITDLPRLVRADPIGYNELERDQAGVRLTVFQATAWFQPHQDLELFGRLVPEHPLIARYWMGGSDEVLKFSDFLSPRDYHRLGLYQQYFRRFEIEDQMAVTLLTGARNLIGIALCRTRRNFRERERQMLALARPHLVQAFHNARALDAARRRAAEGDGAPAEPPLIVLDASGRRLIYPESAGRLLHKYFVARSRGGGIPAGLMRWAAAQREAMNRLQPCSPLVLEREGSRLVVRWVAQEEFTCLLLAEEPATASGARLDLSPREIEVMQWVGQGKTNYEIAAILAISVRTVQKHLENIFVKLGVETRTAAADRVWRAQRGGPASENSL